MSEVLVIANLEDSIEIVRTTEELDDISRQLAKTYLSALRDRQRMEMSKFRASPNNQHRKEVV